MIAALPTELNANVTINGAQLTAFLLATVRIIAWLFVAPPFNSRSVPTMVKVVMSLALALVVTGDLVDDRLPTTTRS